MALVAAMAAAACGGSGYASSPSPMPTPTPGGGGTTTTADVTITISGMTFSPSQASVKVGQSVAWRNADSIAHDPTGTSFGTGLIEAGRTSAPITFTAAGTSNYHCAIHPSMLGTLNITQ